METTEKIVESYCRYIKGLMTIPNIRCKGQYEIDLLAADVSKRTVVNRFHIETSVSISRSYSKLTSKQFSQELLRERVQVAGQRRTIGYFAEKKFNTTEVIEMLAEYGFYPGNYSKVIVTWGWTKSAEAEAAKSGILLWAFPDILNEIAELGQNTRSYFTDDTLRTIQLLTKADVP